MVRFFFSRLVLEEPEGSESEIDDSSEYDESNNPVPERVQDGETSADKEFDQIVRRPSEQTVHRQPGRSLETTRCCLNEIIHDRSIFWLINIVEP